MNEETKQVFLFMFVFQRTWGVRGPANMSFTKNIARIHFSSTLRDSTKSQTFEEPFELNPFLYKLELKPCVAPSSEEVPNATQTLTVSQSFFTTALMVGSKYLRAEGLNDFLLYQQFSKVYT